MPETVQKVRVFLASPGDVKVERAAMSEVVDEINRAIGAAFGFVLELVRWETHALPGMGRPQGIVNELLGTYDVFVGVMWKRFGTPTGVADSGTAEEFERAYAEWERDRELPILFYFSLGKYRVASEDEIAQLSKVVAFRSKLNKLGLVWTYPSASKFADTVRPHLTKLLCDRMRAVGAPPARSGEPLDERTGARGPTCPDPTSPHVPEAHDPADDEIEVLSAPEPPARPAGAQPDPRVLALFEKLWPHLEPEAQQAFSLAFNASNGGVKTEALFAALRAVADAKLDPLLAGIGARALPNPTPADVEDDRTILDARPWFSPCVADSIENLAKIAERGESISAADLFVDIAKYGTGASVMRLRENGIDAAAIDRLAKAYGVRMLQRGPRGATYELPAG